MGHYRAARFIPRGKTSYSWSRQGWTRVAWRIPRAHLQGNEQGIDFFSTEAEERAWVDRLRTEARTVTQGIGKLRCCRGWLHGRIVPPPVAHMDRGQPWCSGSLIPQVFRQCLNRSSLMSIHRFVDISINNRHAPMQHDGCRSPLTPTWKR